MLPAFACDVDWLPRQYLLVSAETSIMGLREDDEKPSDGLPSLRSLPAVQATRAVTSSGMDVYGVGREPHSVGSLRRIADE